MLLLQEKDFDCDDVVGDKAQLCFCGGNQSSIGLLLREEKLDRTVVVGGKARLHYYCGRERLSTLMRWEIMLNRANLIGERTRLCQVVSTKIKWVSVDNSNYKFEIGKPEPFWQCNEDLGCTGEAHSGHTLAMIKI